ncbi:MAG: hypothetical protein KDD47_07015 [Acidobacteria bacterium]|nr:hypothetical protein [Acidobacteriota bacterium]
MASLWTDSLEVPEDTMVLASVGPLRLVVIHLPGEWRLAWARNGVEPAAETASPEAPPVPVSEIGPPEPLRELEPEFTVQRFLSHRPGDRIRLSPRLADRPVVARPELPLTIPAGDEAEIFVSAPVWVLAELPEPDRTLLDLPTQRPSDTWFGPDTRRGVVAYAIRTAARLHIDRLPRLPHRAISCIRVRNQADGPLLLERLSVPAPELPLFLDRNGALWTASLLVERESTSQPARVEVADLPPQEAEGAQRIAGPRIPPERNVISRAFHVLIG